MGNVQFAGRLLHLFTERFAGDLERLEQHLATGEADELARLAHAMKGACANIAAPRLREHASRVEESARERRLHQIPARLALLRDEWECFVDSLTSSGLPHDGPGPI